MTQFNPDKKDSLTYSECLGPAMKITEQEDADQYIKEYIEFTQKHLDIKPNEKGLTAEEIVKINLGYYAGYYDNETRERVERLFCCSHPVFGNLKSNGPHSIEKSLTLGKIAAKGGIDN